MLQANFAVEENQNSLSFYRFWFMVFGMVKVLLQDTIQFSYKIFYSIFKKHVLFLTKTVWKIDRQKYALALPRQMLPQGKCYYRQTWIRQRVA